MKEIQPVSIWYNGQIVSATILNLISNIDNLSTTANFYYQLYSSENVQLASGYIDMIGEDYITYSSSPDSNAYAYQWAATQLNLTLV